MHPNGRLLILPPFSFSPTPTWTVCQSHKPISSSSGAWASLGEPQITHSHPLWAACMQDGCFPKAWASLAKPDHKNSNTRLRGKILRKKQIYLFRASFCAGIRACVVACALLQFGDRGQKKRSGTRTEDPGGRQRSIQDCHIRHIYKHTMRHKLNSTEIVCANLFF